ncbi:unnamed protein product, partial [Acanthocheilonema viteae]
NYEMYVECDDWADWTVPQLSPLERIELLKAKCKQVHKWIGQGLKSDIPEPESPSVLVDENLFEVFPRPLFTYNAMEELD